MNSNLGWLKKVGELGALVLVVSILMAGCGGGGGNSSASNTPAALTPAQIAALTPTDISTFVPSQIAALGVNIKYLSNPALIALTVLTNNREYTSQIAVITAAQIAVLTPEQVRMIGAAGPGGTVGTSQIAYLNSGAWSALVSDPVQVAAITADETKTLSDAEITAFGTNIKSLSNAALGALSPSTTGWHWAGQIESISAIQIAVLSPAQVRFIGSTGVGGATTTSYISALNAGTWATLVSDPLQVAAITAAEIPTLTDAQIIAFDTNFNFLSDAAIGALRTNVFNTSNGQVQSISAAEISVLIPAQIGIIAGINTGFGIDALNLGAFGALSAAQVAVLIPSNVVGVTAAQLSALTTTAIAGLTPATIASLTVTQKASLSPAQHSVCGC